MKQQLIKTDYDNFRDMRFFVEQQRKAQEMMREVEDFQRSFIMSKFISMKDYVRENPMYGYELFPDYVFDMRYYESDEDKPVAFLFTSWPINMPIYRRKDTKKNLNLENTWAKQIYVNMTAQEEHMLDELYFAIAGRTFYDPIHNEIKAEKKYITKKEAKGYNESSWFTTEKKSRPLEKTSFILDWQNYVDIDKIKELIADDPDAMYTYPYYTKKYGWSKNSWKVLIGSQRTWFKSREYIKNHNQLREILSERFKDAIDIYKRFYYEDVEQTAKRKCCGLCCPDDKCYVVYNGEIEFVSPHPEKYKSIINDDNTITFEFKYHDEDSEETKSVWIYTTRLTYSIDNNELLKYETK